ncbi:uncharacterized protein [Haliotis cracherodii]|uniref:uncharacterized protein n=1 Tax=Haliotis cracherodii TaxID=6455 RepID=UPI0039E844F8
MAYNSSVNAGPVPDKFVDKEVESRTVRVYSTARFTTVPDFARLLTTVVPDLSLPDCQAIWRTERAGQVYVTLTSVSTAKKLLDLNCVTHGAEKLYFYAYGVFKIPLRIHWLHATVTSDFLKDFFSRYGKVLDAFREFVDVDGVNIYTGIRIVRMELTESERTCIPHIVRFGDKQSMLVGGPMLVTAPGRLPICLKCHSVGHVRARCPGTDIPTHSTGKPTVAPVIVEVDTDMVKKVPDDVIDGHASGVSDSEPVTDMMDNQTTDVVSVPEDIASEDSQSAGSDMGSSESEEEAMVSEQVLPPKRKQCAQDLPDEVDKRKKVASDSEDRSASTSWAEQQSQTDILLAQVPEEYQCPVSSGSVDTVDVHPKLVKKDSQSSSKMSPYDLTWLPPYEAGHKVPEDHSAEEKMMEEHIESTK